jgi:hypothetical protein
MRETECMCLKIFVVFCGVCGSELVPQAWFKNEFRTTKPAKTSGKRSSNRSKRTAAEILVLHHGEVSAQRLHHQISHSHSRYQSCDSSPFNVHKKSVGDAATYLPPSSLLPSCLPRVRCAALQPPCQHLASTNLPAPVCTTR